MQFSVPFPAPPHFESMVHNKADIDTMMPLSDAATTNFAKAIEVEGVPSWLAIRLQGHVQAMQHAPCCEKSALAALQDLESWRIDVPPTDAPLHRHIEMALLDAVVWRVQLHARLDNRKEFMKVLERALGSAGLWSDRNFHSKVMNAHKKNVSEAFKDKVFASNGKDKPSNKMMIAMCEHSKSVAQGRPGVWKKWAYAWQNMKIHDSPNLKRGKVIEESDADEIISIIYRSKH